MSGVFLITRDYLLMIAELIKTLEARQLPGYQNAYKKIKIGDKIRLQAGNGPPKSNFGSEHLIAQVLKIRTYTHAGAMIEAEDLQKLVGPGATAEKALNIYRDIGTLRLLGLETSKAQDKLDREEARALLKGNASATQMEKFLRAKGVRPKTYSEAPMRKTLSVIALEGIVGQKRDARAPKPGAKRWDEWVRTQKEISYVVWEIKIISTHIYNFTAPTETKPSPHRPTTKPLVKRPPRIRTIPRKHSDI